MAKYSVGRRIKVAQRKMVKRIKPIPLDLLLALTFPFNTWRLKKKLFAIYSVNYSIKSSKSERRGDPALKF
jgi:hypothetical protein